MKKHPLLLRVPNDLFEWISTEAQKRRWSNPMFVIDMLENDRRRIESKRKGNNE